MPDSGDPRAPTGLNSLGDGLIPDSARPSGAATEWRGKHAQGEKSSDSIGGRSPTHTGGAGGSGPFNETVTPRDMKVQLAEQRLTVDWKDGRRSVFALGRLRRVCPCATCRTERESAASRPAGSAASLPVLKADPTGLRVTSARLVGNYAIQFFWSDGHYTGIYDFRFLRSLDDEPGRQP